MDKINKNTKKYKIVSKCDIYPGENNGYNIIKTFEDKKNNYSMMKPIAEVELFNQIIELKNKLSNAELSSLINKINNYISSERNDANWDATYNG